MGDHLYAVRFSSFIEGKNCLHLARSLPPVICKKKEAVNPMNFATLIMSVLFLTGTILCVRTAVRVMQRTLIVNPVELSTASTSSSPKECV